MKVEIDLVSEISQRSCSLSRTFCLQLMIEKGCFGRLKQAKTKPKTVPPPQGIKTPLFIHPSIHPSTPQTPPEEERKRKKNPTQIKPSLPSRLFFSPSSAAGDISGRGRRQRQSSLSHSVMKKSKRGAQTQVKGIMEKIR